MKIRKAELETMVTRRSQYPDNALPEFLLVGRSNVGKSSFINCIIERKNFARISGKPGKTQTLNFYNVNKSFYLVDVPGYGYAEVSKKIHKKFGLMIEDYLKNRKQLKHVFLLVDIRHKPTEGDIQMYDFLKWVGVRVTVIGTKVDKIGTPQLKKHVDQILESLDLVVGDDFIPFSGITKDGRDEVIETIKQYL